MDSGTSGNLTLEELRERFAQEKLYKHQELLSILEDPNFERPVAYLADDTKYLFHRLRHGELTLLTRLPFFPKLASSKPLDETEQAQLQQMKLALLGRVSQEPERWKRFIMEKPEHIDPAFTFLLSTSGMPVGFDQKLTDFFDTDFGYTYGQVWFSLMRLTPSQVAQLSEPDYQAVMMWILKNAERLSKR